MTTPAARLIAALETWQAADDELAAAGVAFFHALQRDAAGGEKDHAAAALRAHVCETRDRTMGVIHDAAYATLDTSGRTIRCQNPHPPRRCKRSSE
jgi:hypothetical protein